MSDLDQLRDAVREYLSECDNPVPDLLLRRRFRDRLRALVGAPAAPDLPPRSGRAKRIIGET